MIRSPKLSLFQLTRQGKVHRDSAVTIVLVLLLSPAAAARLQAQPFIDMGPAPLLGALDQPFVSFSIRDGDQVFGPDPSSRSFLLDTGATSILAVGGAAADLHRSGGRFAEDDFLEQGVGGFIPYDVSAPYTVEISGSNTILRDHVRILSDPFSTFGEGVQFEGIVGMPGLVDRVTTLDLGAGADPFGSLSGVDIFNLDSLIDALAGGSSGVASGIGVHFADFLPASNGHRYHVPLRPLYFPPEEPGIHPTATPLPILTVEHHLEGRVSTGHNYIMDTGAQLSFISSAKAAELGLGPADAFDTLPISGVGGVIDVPAYFVEELRIPTAEGIDLVWRDVQILGLDLHPSLDGVIGSDILTAGMIETNLEAIDFDDLFKIGNGPLQKVHFDFRQFDLPDQSGTGTMLLDLNPDVDVVRMTPVTLQPGDADQDLDFDQFDLIFVLEQGKYLTGQAAVWEEGDWNGGPGGRPGAPPRGDGLFDQLDIVAALNAGAYNAGRYANLSPNGAADDAQTSIVYDAATGEISVNAPAGGELTSVNIDSLAGIFTLAAAENLGGSFDNDSETNIFKATFGGSFGSISFGKVARTGLSEQFLLNDLTVVGSLAGGGELGPVDLVYVPEPHTLILLLLALIASARAFSATV